jgi:ABC-type Fe3+/spermidine/putrescine transport system ATPase subunit
MLVLTRQARQALSAADRLAVMDLGKIVQVGTPQDVYNQPADAFVARLLGPINLLQGQVDTHEPNAKGEVIVRTPLGRLIGRAAGGVLAAGAPVTVAIRPETLSLAAAIPPGSNRFPASVERIAFRGELRQIHLRGPGDWPVTAMTLQSQSNHVREGQTLAVSVSPEFVVVLPGKYSVSAPRPS